MHGAEQTGSLCSSAMRMQPKSITDALAGMPAEAQNSEPSAVLHKAVVSVL